MSFTEEIRRLLDTDRKRIREELGVSTALLSQWSTGKELISEPHLASMVNLGAGASDTKEEEFIRLFVMLSKERIIKDNANEQTKRRWTNPSAALALRALDRLLGSAANRSSLRPKEGATLANFPESFYPLAIISGDKRETSQTRISKADFGAVSASHAEFRWLCALGLREDVEIYGDKIFVREKPDRLKARFGRRHLLVVGSPASNHLARRCMLAQPVAGWRTASPIFRFNVPQTVLQNIELSLEKLDGLSRRELVGKQAEERTEAEMKTWLRYLFQGGILDPTNTDLWIHGHAHAESRDYGLISLARNPFSDPSDRFYCILVAGFHLFGTAYGIKMLASRDNFDRHPFGGVMKVEIDTDLEFGDRFDSSVAEWDDPAGYDKGILIERLKRMQGNTVPHLHHITQADLEACLEFVTEF